MKERESNSCQNCKYNKEKNIRQGSLCWECKNEATPYDRYPYWELDDLIDDEYEDLLDYQEYLKDEEEEDEGLYSW